MVKLYIKNLKGSLFKKRVGRISKFLSVEVVSEEPLLADVFLVLDSDCMYLKFPTHNFTLKLDLFRIKLKKDIPLLKAIGKKRQIVFDLTAGFGKDSWILASFGHSVVAFEKNKLAYLIFNEALSRTRIYFSQVPLRIRTIWGDSLEFLRGFSKIRKSLLLPWPDVIYIDPFLPPKSTEKRLPKKYIQALRIIGLEENNEVELIKDALNIAKKRVVVKRAPKFKGPLLDPTFSVKGKSVVFDVYLTQR